MSINCFRQNFQDREHRRRNGMANGSQRENVMWRYSLDVWSEICLFFVFAIQLYEAVNRIYLKSLSTGALKRFCRESFRKLFHEISEKLLSSTFHCHTDNGRRPWWISLLKWIRKLLQTRTWNVFFLCFCCTTRMKIWEKRTPENAIAICSFIIHWNQIPWAEADDETSKDFCSLWMNFHCCIIASKMLWVASASATQRTRRRQKKHCLFLYVIHMMLFYLSAAHNDGDDEKKEEKTYHEILFSNSKGKQVVKIFFCVHSNVCEKKERKNSRRFDCIFQRKSQVDCLMSTDDSSWGCFGDRKLRSPWAWTWRDIAITSSEKSFSDFPLAGRTRADFSSFSSSTTSRSRSRFSRSVQLKLYSRSQLGSVEKELSKNSEGQFGKSRVLLVT